MTSASPKDPLESSDSPFPGWEPFLPQLVQVKKAIRGVVGEVGESNLRYPLNHLAKIGVLEIAPQPRLTAGFQPVQWSQCHLFPVQHAEASAN